MEAGDWITLAAVIVALGIGTASIWHTRSMQKKERRERLLNEIIEWASDVGKRGADINFLLLAAEIDAESWGEPHLPTLQSNLRELNQRGEYMAKVTGTLDKSLLIAVRKINSEVAGCLSAIDSIFIQTRLGTAGINLSMILKPLSKRDSLTICADNLLTEAAKLKTRDIS